MKTIRIAQVMAIFTTFCSLAFARLPQPNLVDINTLHCNTPNFGKGEFTISFVNNTIELYRLSKTYTTYEVIKNTKKLEFSFAHYSMILNLDSTVKKEDQNGVNYYEYHGMLNEVLNDSNPDGTTISSASCYKVD